MKRIHISCVAAVLLLTGVASADLTVYEYVPGERVTYDDVTGYYWYTDLMDFSYMTYNEQTSAIADLGTYGGIAGGWHRAYMEMSGLIDNGPAAIGGHFEIVEISPRAVAWRGFYDDGDAGWEETGFVGLYEVWYVDHDWDDPIGWYWADLAADTPYDGWAGGGFFPSWVVSTHPMVPLPGAVILATTGLLSSTLGLKRLRRKR